MLKRYNELSDEAKEVAKAQIRKNEPGFTLGDDYPFETYATENMIAFTEAGKIYYYNCIY